MQGVVLQSRDPVFLTAFSPLCMIITSALGYFILAEQLHLGRYVSNPTFFVSKYFVYTFLQRKYTTLDYPHKWLLQELNWSQLCHFPYMVHSSHTLLFSFQYHWSHCYRHGSLFCDVGQRQRAFRHQVTITYN